MSVDDDFMGPGEVFVWLNEGYAFYPSEDYRSAEHCRGCSSPTEALKAVKEIAQPCSCERCQGEANTRIDLGALKEIV